MTDLKNKKILAVLIILLLVILIIAGFFLLNPLKKAAPRGAPGTTPITTNESVNVLVAFSPSIIKTANSKTISADVMLDVGKYATQGLVLNLSYDPTKIKNFTFTSSKDPNSALSNSLEVLPGLTTQDTTKGTYSITYGLRKNIPEQKGRGIIGKVTATVISAPTVITIDPSSSAATKMPGIIFNLGRVNLEIQP